MWIDCSRRTLLSWTRRSRSGALSPSGLAVLVCHNGALSPTGPAVLVFHNGALSPTEPAVLTYRNHVADTKEHDAARELGR
jgi:hypothetical protein